MLAEGMVLAATHLQWALVRVGDGISSFFANLHLGLGGGGLQVTCSACRGPAVH